MKLSKETLRLYAVSDRRWLFGQPFSETIEELLKAGITMLQLREKDCSTEERIALANAIKPLTKTYGVPLIINDDVDAAKRSDADGVHVGLSDMSVQNARKLLGENKIIGASAHNVAEALEAQRQGAHYLGCGAVFGSTSKTDVGDLPMTELQKICKAVTIPVVAIGGICQDNLFRLAGTGIAGVAMISAVFQPEDKKTAVQTLLTLVSQLTKEG